MDEKSTIAGRTAANDPGPAGRPAVIVSPSSPELPLEGAAGSGIEDRLFTHLLTVLSVSAGMVGVCLTAIGLVGVVSKLTKAETICDDLLAADALLYLIVCLLSFIALRTPLHRRARSIALWVDILLLPRLGPDRHRLHAAGVGSAIGS